MCIKTIPAPAKNTLAELNWQLVNIEVGIIPLLLLCVMIGYYIINRYIINPIVLISNEIKCYR